MKKARKATSRFARWVAAPRSSEGNTAPDPRHGRLESPGPGTWHSVHRAECKRGGADHRTLTDKFVLTSGADTHQEPDQDSGLLKLSAMLAEPRGMFHAPEGERLTEETKGRGPGQPRAPGTSFLLGCHSH